MIMDTFSTPEAAFTQIFSRPGAAYARHNGGEKRPMAAPGDIPGMARPGGYAGAETKSAFHGENFSLLFGMLEEGAYCVDKERRIVQWNAAAERITGYQASEVLGRFCCDDVLCHVDERGAELCTFAAWCPMHLTTRDGQPREINATLLHRDGSRVPVRIKTMALSDATGAISGALQFFDEKGAVEKLREQLESASRAAYIDFLTGLPNRRFIDVRLAQSIEELERYGWAFACFVADIDHFKRINDEFGHETGDQTLCTAFNAIASACRGSDLVGRYGGDEAVGTVKNIDKERLESTLDRVLELVCHTGNDGTLPGAVTVSIGATIARKGDTPRTLIERADTGLYRSKRAGRNRYTIV